MKLSDGDTGTYNVRKTNQVNYKGNFYSLPMGTYTGRGTRVRVQRDGPRIEIYDLEGTLLCSHRISTEKGRTVTNTDHKRDRSVSVAQMMDGLAGSFSDPQKATAYFKKIQGLLPRYTRDHLQAIKKTVKVVPKDIADRTLDFCTANRNYCGHDFESVSAVLWDTDTPAEDRTVEIKPLRTADRDKADERPETSDINDYESIINPK